MPELPWEKWYPTNWASEPGLRLCEAATRGIWFEAINTMMLKQTGSISGTVEQLASLCVCRTPQMQLAIEQLKSFGVADVYEQNGNITISCRKRTRDCNIKQVRRAAGIASGTKRRTKPQQRSASAYASVCTSDSVPDWEQCILWLHGVKKNGADYTEKEMKGAFLALSAGGWTWGMKPIADWRAAIERQIQTDRSKNNHTSPGRPETTRDREKEKIDRAIASIKLPNAK